MENLTPQLRNFVHAGLEIFGLLFLLCIAGVVLFSWLARRSYRNRYR